MSARTPVTAPLWWAVAAVGVLVLPWHLQDGAARPSWLLAPAADVPAAASAAAQALRFGRWWLLPPVIALLAAVPAAFLPMARQRRGAWLLAAAGAGLLSIVLQGFAVGLRGWSAAWLEAVFGALADRQGGVGVGAALTVAGFLFLVTEGAALRGAFRGDRFVAGAVGLLAASVCVFTVWPVARILAEAVTARGDAGALGVLAARLADPRIWGLGCVGGGRQCGVAVNTIALAAGTAAAATAMGLAFALLVTRTSLRARRLLRLLTVLPIVTPPFVIGLGLILIFGRAGLVNQAIEAVTGATPGRWIYGFPGVWLAQVFSFTPTAFLVLIGVVEGLSPTLEEASLTLRASPMRTFQWVTLPLMRPGLANAFLVVFVESIADFGNPIVLGGSFGVLSTEIFFAVVGAQADFGRAATLALLLLGLALGLFFVQRTVVGRRSYVAMTGKGDAGLAMPLPAVVARVAGVVAIPWAVLTVTVYALALSGAFVKVWGRDWTPTLSHFQRAFALETAPGGGLIFSGGAWSSLFTTVTLAAIAAPITAAVGLVAAWVLARQRFAGRTALEFVLMLTFAVPGTVIGVAYILTYNVPPLELTGTATILVLCFVSRNLPVGVRSGLAAMSQIDRSLDEASATLGASSGRTLRRVVLPLLRPAVVTALVYSFVRAMTTVSAVIFLVSAEYEMATVFIVNRVINGDYGLAVAYSATLVVLMGAAIGAIQLLVGRRRLGRRAPDLARELEAVGGRA